MKFLDERVEHPLIVEVDRPRGLVDAARHGVPAEDRHADREVVEDRHLDVARGHGGQDPGLVVGPLDGIAVPLDADDVDAVVDHLLDVGVDDGLVAAVVEAEGRTGLAGLRPPDAVAPLAVGRAFGGAPLVPGKVVDRGEGPGGPHVVPVGLGLAVADENRLGDGAGVAGQVAGGCLEDVLSFRDRLRAVQRTVVQEPLQSRGIRIGILHVRLGQGALGGTLGAPEGDARRRGVHREEQGRRRFSALLGQGLEHVDSILLDPRAGRDGLAVEQQAAAAGTGIELDRDRPVVDLPILDAAQRRPALSGERDRGDASESEDRRATPRGQTDSKDLDHDSPFPGLIGLIPAARGKACATPRLPGKASFASPRFGNPTCFDGACGPGFGTGRT